MSASSVQFFEQDDEETLELLLNGSSEDDMAQRLSGLANRFSSDSKDTSEKSFWDSITKSAEELGFRVSGVSTAVPSLAAEQDTAADSSFPAAFETDSGKKHIEATSSLLRISKRRAVQLTLSALRSLNGGNDAGETHIGSLLGTKALLKTVRDYHYQQRTARLLAITECLRIEQDEDSPNHAAAVNMLNDLDKSYCLDGRQRGLFQHFTDIACAPYSPPTRQELLPSLDLRSETADTLVGAQMQFSNSNADAFVTDCFEASKLQTLLERVQAMEALLVLLYHRIQEGIHRVDYILLLLAFDSCATFFTALGNERLSFLAGLVTAECMNLCMTNSQEANANGIPLWIVQHPLLLGVVEGDVRAVRELETLVMLLKKYAIQVPARKQAAMAIRTTTNGSNGGEAPEAIALYSFSLLLCLVQLHLPSEQQEAVAQESNDASFDFGKHGMECAQIASDDCGVFDYLYATMEALVKTPIRDSFSSESDVPYDWQFSGDSTAPQLEGPSEQEALNAQNVAYSSIGLEILTATIVAFKDTIRTGNRISLENVAVLSNLAASIYGNHPLLCNAFWKNLEVYTSEGSHENGTLTSKQALCYLVDAAHACATSALNAVALATPGDNPGLEENLLPSLIPLLQLMSSLCSNSEMIGSVLRLLPEGTIRIALLCCVPTSSVSDSTAFTKNALQIVQAVQTLARVGRSSSVRAKLRASLEEKGVTTNDGPRVLYRIISWQQSTDIVSSALRIVGYFVESSGGNELWVAKAANLLGPSGLGENGLSALLTGQSRSVALSCLHVLSGLVGNLAAMAFSPGIEPTDFLDALYVAMKGVTASCMLLTALVSSTTGQNQEAPGSSFLAAHGVMRCCAMFLRELRPIINMHDSLRIKAASQETRNTLLQALSTSTPVGQAIAYFASAPVSLSLAIVLEEMLQNANVLQIASNEYLRESDALDFGAWRSVADASREMKPTADIAKVRSDGVKLGENIQHLDIDLQGFQAKRWTDDAMATEPLLAASAALDLLRLWALSASEIVVEKHGLRSGDDASLSQEAVSDLEALSPCRLIFSQVVVPPVVERSSSLRQVWPTNTLSLFNTLVRYMGGQSEGPSEQLVPSLIASDALSLALADAKHFSETLRFSIVETVGSCAPSLSFILKRDIVEAGSVLSEAGPEGELSPEDDMRIRKGLACLGMLSVCMELDPRVVIEICKGDATVLDDLVTILSSTATVVVTSKSLARVSADPFLTSHLRLASAALHALVVLWNSSSVVSETVAEISRDTFKDIVAIVKFASAELPLDYPEEPNILHVVSVLTALASDALGILAVESRDEPIKSEVYDMVNASFSSLSLAFTKVNATVMAAKSWSKLASSMQTVRNVRVDDPLSVFSSFPASYRSTMESHKTQENFCDIVAAASCMQDPDESVNELKKCAAAFSLMSRQLALASSWGRFALTISLVDTNGSAKMAEDANLLSVLVNLGRIAVDIEEAQMLVDANYLPLDVAIVSNELAGLLVDMLGITENKISAAEDGLIDMLSDLHSTSEKLVSSTSLNRSSYHVISLAFPSYLVRDTTNIREKTAFMCHALQKRLVVAASLLFSALDQKAHSRQNDSRLAQVALQYVESACTNLELKDYPEREDKVDRNVLLSDDLLNAKVSLLNLLLSRDRGTKSSITGASQFYLSVAASMKRLNVMETLATNVTLASTRAVAHASRDTSNANPLLVANENQVEKVQSILGLVRTIAEIGQNSDDMLSLLSSTTLSIMITGNRLFETANQQWVSHRFGGHGSDHLSELRGYLPLKGKVPVETFEANSRTILSGTFLSGRDDPVHFAWRTALQILQATVSASSKSLFEPNGSRHYVQCALAFLRKFSTSLVACLNQCSSLSSDGPRGTATGTATAAQVSHTVLTFNVLGEAADILALFSSLCRTGTYLQMFEDTCGDVYHALAEACYAVLDGLSEFLAAAGTSKELFEAIKDYEAELRANDDRDAFGFNEQQIDINPLLTNGTPMARHEAIKYAHYASRCCALVTAEDYKGLPAISGNTVGASTLTSTLELDSQLTMKSPFITRMEHAAAECVSIVIAVLSDTHPASSCFITFSPEELLHRDMLPLLKERMVISALAEEGSSDASCFYRILHVDTVHRMCHVQSLDEEGEQTQSTFSVDRVNGIEDMTKRHPILAFSAAPSSYAELERVVTITDHKASLGDIIAVLRWCYQSTCGGGTDDEERRTLRKLVAESTSVLLSTEVSLHQEIGTFSLTKQDDLSKHVMSQLLELFDDSNKAPKWSGKLKQMIDPEVWPAIQKQLDGELRIARSDRRERSLKNLKRATAVNAGPSVAWFNTGRQQTATMAGQP